MPRMRGGALMLVPYRSGPATRKAGWAGQWGDRCYPRRTVRLSGEELAREVAAIKQEDPGRPVYLLGHSAGAAIVVRAAECLPGDTVERIVLLAAALSPTYDLRRALAATRVGIVSYYSRHDTLFL